MRKKNSKKKKIPKKELEKLILQEKEKGTTDAEIGRKYNANLREIERIVTKHKGVNVSSLRATQRITKLEPKDFTEEHTTVWSFKNRGKWATHRGDYRGNWSPYIPRNVILKYSEPGEMVLDYFCGAGTTAIEAKLLGRQFAGFDINDKAIELSQRNVDFEIKTEGLLFGNQKESLRIYEPKLFVGDARQLRRVENESIDLICAHPPYSDIIHYTDNKPGDLSFFGIEAFLIEMAKVADESFRVLKPGRQCAILIGDTRKKKHIIPLGFWTIKAFLSAGFRLKELVIKRQHNCKTTGFWYANSLKYNFLLLAHEYLPIFEKPKKAKAVREKDEVEYAIDLYANLCKIEEARRISEFETTTVWIFPKKEMKRKLNKNVIDRYSEKKGYHCISIVGASSTKTTIEQENGKSNLLFVKSPLLEDEISVKEINGYKKKMLAIVEDILPNINRNGFLIIQTKDVRVNGFIVPIAMELVDVIDDKRLWLKEIVLVTSENHKEKAETGKSKELKIAHQYLLVYDVTE